MNLPSNIRPFWDEFQASIDFDASSRFYEVFHFDDNEATANFLVELVLKGTKRATASLVWVYEAENKPIPKAGDLSVVTNWAAEPLCVIKTKIVTIVLFEEVTQEFASIEGEGDKSLGYWQEQHWLYFGRECQRLGKELSLVMPVVCEQFEVIYRYAANKA